MTEVKRRRKKDGPRTEVFAMRLDPKLKYLAEIASRQQRRSMANFIEWAIQEALRRIDLQESEHSPSIWDYSNELWDIEASDRLAKLAFNAPHLLTYDEQIVWKLVCENSYFWRGNWKQIGNSRRERFTWDTSRVQSLMPERLREKWGTLLQVASGEQEQNALPDVDNERDMEADDIPF